ncbi:MAG: MBL fold metallo-hydrolase [Alicyclobacillus sp.]|nr:MBL fold metallo-hydrolase [Alicyclobacillus sp.]
MKVHVLGCWGAYPEAGEATTGVLVEHGGQRMLIDCGSGVLAQLFQRVAVPDLSAVILTHHHHDHAADLGVLTYALLLSRLQGTRTQKLPMYMLDGPADRMKELRSEPLIDLHVVGPSDALTLGGMHIRFTPTVHPVPCMAVRIDTGDASFVFSADSSWTDGLVELATGASLFLCECSMYRGQERDAVAVGHMTAPQVGEMAEQAGVGHLVLTHLPHYGDHGQLVAQAKAAYAGRVSLAATGSTYEV